MLYVRSDNVNIVHLSFGRLLADARKIIKQSTGRQEIIIKFGLYTPVDAAIMSEYFQCISVSLQE